jgi:hypothetical protein
MLKNELKSERAFVSQLLHARYSRRGKISYRVYPIKRVESKTPNDKGKVRNGSALFVNISNNNHQSLRRIAIQE